MLPLFGVAMIPWPVQAAAEWPIPGVRVHLGTGEVSQPIRVEGLHPGAQRHAVFLFEGDEAELAQRVQIRALGVVDRENGCNSPENSVPDTSCEAGATGELSSHVDVGIRSGQEAPDGSGSCVPAGEVVTRRLADLSAAPIVVGMPSGGQRPCLVAVFEHVITSSDNLTQTDSVEFDLGLAFDQLPVGPEVEGEQGTSATPGDSGSPLAVEGVDAVAVTPTQVNAGVLVLEPATERAVSGRSLILGGLVSLTGSVLLLVAASRASRRGRHA